MPDGLITLVEVTAYDPAIPGTRVLRFTSGLGTMTRPTEVPPNVHFAPRLQQPIRFKRTMFSAARLAGGSTVGVGDIVLNNLDQGLANLRDLGIDGREVVVRVGPQDAPYPAGFTTFLTGTAEQVEVGARTVTIRLRDKLQMLALPLQANLYAGNNALPAGAEGKHLLAPEMLRDTCLQQPGDMATEASRILALHKVRRDFTQAAVWLTQARAAIDLGTEVRLVTNRLGYGAGRTFRVVGIDLDGVQTAAGTRSQLTLDLWG
jgi:hypothetical protein